MVRATRSASASPTSGSPTWPPTHSQPRCPCVSHRGTLFQKIFCFICINLLESFVAGNTMGEEMEEMVLVREEL